MCGFVRFVVAVFQVICVICGKMSFFFLFCCQCCPFLLTNSKKQSTDLIFRIFELILHRFVHKRVEITAFCA